jgi:hypothetical protein
MSITSKNTITKMKARIASDFHRLSLVLRIETTLMHHASTAAKKNNPVAHIGAKKSVRISHGKHTIKRPKVAACGDVPPAEMYKGPTQATSAVDSEPTFCAELAEKAYKMPKPMQATMGSARYAGAFDSLDFCKRGREMILSSVFTTNINCRTVREL